jgi:photosystem II stability/assembly factor-like uncharacterized protein
MPASFVPKRNGIEAGTAWPLNVRRNARRQQANRSYMKSIILFLILLRSSELGFSQWTHIGGPSGLYQNDMIFTKCGRLISSTSSQGVFLSDDYGSTWTNRNVYSLIGKVFCITERANRDLLATTQRGIAKSTDGGDTWSIIFSRSDLTELDRIYESSTDSALFHGASGRIYKSTNGGFTWAEIWNTGNPGGFALNDSGLIYLSANGQLFRSSDGGFSFSQLSLPDPIAGRGISNIIPARTGGLYFAANVYADYSIYYYENGQAFLVQAGWINIPPLGLSSDGNLIYKSGNCIATHNPITKQSFILSCPYFVRDQFAKKVVVRENVWIANFRGEGLHRSTDAGRTWMDINNGLGYKQVLSIEITRQGKIFASGFGDAFWGGLYKSLDDGVTWSRVQPQTIDAYFIDISTLKNGNLIANGSYGVYIADAEGSQWTPRTGITLAYSQYVSSNGIIFVGNDDFANPGIMISSNNGITWVPSRNGIQHSYFFGFGESCSGRIFAAAWPSGTYYSDNQGRDWTYISSGPLSYERAFDFKCRNDTVLAGTSSGIIYSTDNGATWNRFSGLYGSVYRIVVAQNGDILAAVYQRGVYRSKTRGLSWEPYIDGMGNRSVWELSFDRIGRLFAATDSGIFRSDNYRLTPTIVFPPNGATNQPAVITLQWNRIYFAQRYFLQLAEDSLFHHMLVSDSTLVDTAHTVSLGYLTTYYWRVAAVFPYGSTTFSETSSFTTSPPSVFSLKQNYPNPFNTETVIAFDVPTNSAVAIRIYNTLGQTVSTIVNEEFPPGSHRVTWNATAYSSGVYFFRLEAGKFMLTRKALLLR